MDLDPARLLRVYDQQLRAHVPSRLPEGVRIERDGPLVRVAGLDERGFVTYRSLDGVPEAELDALIERQRDFFAARGQGMEWKLHGHDRPADLPDRLRRAGFVPEEQETVVIGLAAPLASREVPDGVVLREVTDRADLERIVAMEEAVWQEDRGWLVNALADEIAADPTGITVVVVEAFDTAVSTEAQPQVVSAGWIRFVEGTPFGTLWGGSTLEEWRRRGIYGALVGYRARLALSRGLEYLQVDASDDSRPILQRAGFVAVTTTTPYVYTP